MEGHRRLVCGATQILALILLIFLFYTQSLTFHNTIDLINPCCGVKQNLSNWNATNLSPKKVAVSQDNLHPSLKSLLSKLLKGEDQRRLETTGFACDSAVYSLVCVASNPVKIDTKTMEVHLPTDQFNPNSGFSLQEHEKVVQVRPYARPQDEDLLKLVTPVKFLHENVTSNPTRCEYNHKIPAIVFSSSGFIGNLFHEFNEIIIPLFLTSRLFQSRVQFIIVDYRPPFVEKFNHILLSLSPYKILNPIVNTSVHCFPGVVAGLKFHDFLAINSSQVPKGHSMTEFKKFLRKTYNLRIKNVSETDPKQPLLILVSRQKTRMFLNEEELVNLFQELGFEVVVIKNDQKMSNLSEFAKLLSTCSVLVGVHGAGLTNEVFLPVGAVVVQVVPLGLEWPSTVYFGGPAAGMGLHHLEYKIEPEESSLVDSYPPDDPVIVDPGSVFAKGYNVGKAVYLDGQNVRVNVDRFRGTIVEAMRLIGRTSPLSRR